MNANLASDRIESATAAFLQRPHNLLIGGRWVPATGGATLEGINPATGRALAAIAAGGAPGAESEVEVQAGGKAFSTGAWAKMRAAEGARLLYRLADAVEANADEIAWLESLDGGNPVGSVGHATVARARAR